MAKGVKKQTSGGDISVLPAVSMKRRRQHRAMNSYSTSEDDEEGYNPHRPSPVGGSDDPGMSEDGAHHMELTDHAIDDESGDGEGDRRPRSGGKGAYR